MNKRLIAALAAYAVLAALAFLMVDEKRMRAAVLLLFGALAAKTLIAWKAQAIRESHSETDANTDVPIRPGIPPQ